MSFREEFFYEKICIVCIAPAIALVRKMDGTNINLGLDADYRSIMIEGMM